MKKETTFTAKQVGGRIKERRTELNITMPELGRRVGVNKSTIQRYEADGVDPKRTMVINGLAEALLTTPEWLTGLSDDKEYDTYTLCQRDIEEHIKKYLDTVSHTLISVTQEIIKREYRNAYKPWKLLMFPGFFSSPETLWNVVKRGEICSVCNAFATRLQQSYSANVLFMASTSICTSRCV